MGQTQHPSGIIVVTGPLTDTQLRATAVPVSGTVTANVGTGTQAVSGTITANAGTGTLAVSGLTDAQLRASAISVDRPPLWMLLMAVAHSLLMGQSPTLN